MLIWLQESARAPSPSDRSVDCRPLELDDVKVDAQDWEGSQDVAEHNDSIWPEGSPWL